MTLNDLEWSFCITIWFELGIQWVGVLAFGENCSEIRRATHRPTVNCKNVAPPHYLLYRPKDYRVIHWVSPKRKRQQVNYVHISQFSHMLFTDVCRK